jgi:hypothetical protein
MVENEPLQPRLLAFAHTARSVAVKTHILPNLDQSYQISQLRVALLAAIGITLVTPLRAFAQTATGNFEEAVKAITGGIQQVSGVAVALLLISGFALLMWSGISESIRVRAVRIIFYTVIGAAGLFLFAEPLATFITDTFKAGA